MPRSVGAWPRTAALRDLAALRLLPAHGAAGGRRAGAVGNTALMEAAARGHRKVVQAQLQASANPAHKNKWGLAADWARWPANAAEVRALLQAGGR
ncbi:MAG: ankyrin repeat domain-containing protein [Rhodospirillales bacterium]|nr:ankyrin repeat domain-containing protein [Rhodospirillales bacterium]